MYKKLFLTIFFACAFPTTIFSMDAGAWATRIINAYQPSEYHLDHKSFSWPYIRAIWTVLLADKTRLLSADDDIKNGLIKRCQDYFEKTIGSRIFHSEEMDYHELSKLIDNHRSILLARELRPDSIKQLFPRYDYAISETVFLQNFDVIFSSGERLPWRAPEETIPYAIATGNISLISYWLSHGVDIDRVFPEYNDGTMFHMATAFGPVSMVEFLISKSPKILMRDAKDRTPMQLAIANNRMDIGDLIVKYQAQSLRSTLLKISGLNSENRMPNQPRSPAALCTNLPSVRVQSNRGEKYLNEKYLDTKSIRSPIAVASQQPESMTMPEPDMSLRLIAQHPPYTSTVLFSSQKQFDGTMHFRIFSKNPLQPPRSFKRTSIVLAGRKHLASIPEEAKDGRVILLVPYNLADEARLWLGDNRDVVVIDRLWDPEGHEIPRDEIGLVTSRRMAAFHLVNIYSLDDFMMLDDNIGHFYVSKKLRPRPKTWPDLYHLFRNTSASAKSTVLSAQTISHLGLSNALNSRDIIVSKHAQASKIFFINMKNIRAKIQTAKQYAWLFPLRRDVFGEDLFFSEALEHLGLSVDAIASKTLAYSRTSFSKHAALHTLDNQFSWATPVVAPRHAPDYHLHAISRMRQIQLSNVTRIEEGNTEQGAANLPLLTAINTEARQAKRLREQTTTQEMSRNYAVTKKRPRKEIVPPVQRVAERLSPPTLQNMPSPIAPLFGAAIDRILGSQLSPAYFLSASFPLYDHQFHALFEFKDHLLAYNRTGYVELPTGAGKTRLFFILLAIALQTPEINRKHIAIIVPTINLVEQTYDAIVAFNKVMAQFGLTIPIRDKVIKVSTGNVSQAHLPYNQDFVDGRSQVVIFCKESFDTLMTEHREFYRDFSLILVDEFHLAGKRTLPQIARAVNDNDILFFGFSATPDGYEDYFKHRISYLSVENAVQEGILCPWENRSLGKWSKEAARNLPSTLAHIFNNYIDLNGHLLKDAKTIIFASNIKQARAIADYLHQSGISAYSFATDIPQDEQDILLRRFALRDGSKNQINVLVAVYKLTTGFDGHVENIVMARNVKKKSIVIQARGRALRPDPLNPHKKALFIAWQDTFDNFDLQPPPAVRNHAPTSIPSVSTLSGGDVLENFLKSLELDAHSNQYDDLGKKTFKIGNAPIEVMEEIAVTNG